MAVIADKRFDLHKLPTKPSLKDEALWPVKSTSAFDITRVVRSDANGRFEMRFRNTYRLREIVAFEENYLNAVREPWRLRPDENGRVEIRPIRLFPAGRIIIEPCVHCPNVRLRFTAQENDDSDIAAIFFNMYHGYFSGPRLEMELRQPYYVPAGVTLKAQFSIPYEDKWCIPDIPQTINLKQGEILDLGPFAFEPAIRICVKVVDSTGNPVRGVPITRSYDDPYHNVEVHTTDGNGVTTFNVEPNSKVQFNILRDDKPWNVFKSITYEIGGREDAGTEFTIQL